MAGESEIEKKAMEQQPLVSIITVCLNSERYIRSAIDSVLSQTYKNIEYILVDGESTDNTLLIIQEHIADFPQLIHLISEPDKGIFDAMNKGIKVSKGEIIGILNSDDWYNDFSIEKAVDLFMSDPDLDIVHGAMANYNPQGILESVYEDFTSRFGFAEKAPFNHPTCFLRRRVYFSKIGLFDLKFKTAADYDLMLQAYHSVDVKSAYIDEVLTNFRKVGVTCSMKISPVFEIAEVLHKNEFNYYIIALTISYRFVRSIAVTILQRLNIHAVLQSRLRWTRGYKRYRNSSYKISEDSK